jgi:hypothetical protein
VFHAECDCHCKRLAKKGTACNICKSENDDQVSKKDDKVREDESIHLVKVRTKCQK